MTPDPGARELEPGRRASTLLAVATTMELRCPRSTWASGQEEEVVQEPSWRDVEAAIRRLDGEEYNDVYLERPDERKWLAVGGGSGRYFVMLTIEAHTPDESWLVACSEGGDEAVESLVVGGQPGNYPARQVVPLELALDAAKAFYATGEPALMLRWERT
jgi:hypothetical protein